MKNRSVITIKYKLILLEAVIRQIKKRSITRMEEYIMNKFEQEKVKKTYAETVKKCQTILALDPMVANYKKSVEDFSIIDLYSETFLYKSESHTADSVMVDTAGNIISISFAAGDNEALRQERLMRVG